MSFHVSLELYTKYMRCMVTKLCHFQISQVACNLDSERNIPSSYLRNHNSDSIALNLSIAVKQPMETIGLVLGVHDLNVRMVRSNHAYIGFLRQLGRPTCTSPHIGFKCCKRQYTRFSACSSYYSYKCSLAVPFKRFGLAGEAGAAHLAQKSLKNAWNQFVRWQKARPH